MKGAVRNAKGAWVYHYPPGTPANDDIPRDEMLLAEALANAPKRLHDGGDGCRVASAIAIDDWRVNQAAFDGACDIIYGDLKLPGPYYEADAYAAGAALAMALEDDA